MDSRIKNAITDFTQSHKLDVVILYGSYARGDNTEASDLDLLGIKSDTNDYTDTRIINGIQLDGWITSFNNLGDLDHFMKLLEGKVICDKDKIGMKLLSEVEANYLAGPKDLSPDECVHIVSWIHKMLKRAETGDIEGNFRRSWLQTDLLKYHFELRNKWYLGPKLAFKQLKLESPQTFDLFEKSLAQPNNLALLKQLAEKVVP